MTAPNPTVSWTIYLRLVLMAAMWGASWPWGKVVAQTMPPLAGTAARCAVAGAVLLPWLLHTKGLAPLRALAPRQWLGLAAAAMLGIWGYSVCFMYALQLAPAGRGSVVITLNPVVTLVLAVWLFKERINTLIALGMALAVTGALSAITGGQPWQLFTGGVGKGEWLLLGCVACWASYTLLGRVVLAGVDAFCATTVMVWLGGLALAATSLAVEGPTAWQHMAQAPASSWQAVLALGLLGTALAYVWYFDGVKALGAGNASAYIALVPVFGLGFASIWLGEPLSPALLLGGAMAISGMVLMYWGRR